MARYARRMSAAAVVRRAACGHRTRDACPRTGALARCSDQGVGIVFSDLRHAVARAQAPAGAPETPAVKTYPRAAARRWRFTPQRGAPCRGVLARLGPNWLAVLEDMDRARVIHIFTGSGSR